MADRNIFEKDDSSYDNEDELNFDLIDKSSDKINCDNPFEFGNKNFQNDDESEIDLDQIYCITPETPKSPGNGKNNSQTKTKTNQNTASETKIIQFKLQEKKDKHSEEFIFSIAKVNKNMGRIKKEKKQDVKGKHDKFSDDNMIQKIKVSFQESCYKYINREYEKNYIHLDTKKAQKFIQRITPKEAKKIKKEDNILWFSLKLKDLFSSDISSKYSKFDENYNKRQIEKLYRENKDKNVIDILEKTVGEMLDDFCNDTPIEGFETLKDDLAKKRKKMEDEEEAPDIIKEYLEKYENNAKTLKDIFLNKKSRNRKKKSKKL